MLKNNFIVELLTNIHYRLFACTEALKNKEIQLLIETIHKKMHQFNEKHRIDTSYQIKCKLYRITNKTFLIAISKH